MISVSVLGPLTLEARGEEIRVPGRRERCVLAVLAIHNGRVVPFTTLEEFLWGDDPPRTARKALQSAVANIRRIVADEGISDRSWLETNEIGYRLSLPVGAVDLGNFESLAAVGSSALDHGDASTAKQNFARALAMWRGDEPTALGDGTSASAERARLTERRLEVLADRIAADLASGDSAGSVAELRGLCQMWPLRERFHEYLMLALHRDGRDIEAISVARELRSRLLDGHGLEPSTRLQELELRILEHDPALLASDNSSTAGRPRSSGRLPRARDLVGRDDELARVGAALREADLITLVGPGGVGKTSLAAEVARREQAGGTDVVWCTLGNVFGDAALVPSIATTLGVTPRAGVTMQEGIIQRLRAGTTLLVADNCEHLLDPVANLVAELLDACPGLRVLATSRERLGIADEQVWPIEGLGVPALLDSGDPLESPAVELFIDRAVRSDAFFRLDEARTAAIVTTCRALDGNPLAIELAAARVRALPPQEIARRLDSRFELLTGRRDEDERHRSLWATVEWSYSLLGDRERKLFRRLGTFAGSFTIEAAQAVAAFGDVDASVPSLLADLVDKSMVASEFEDPSPRFRLLETMQVFARVQLAEAGETETADSALLVYLCEELERLDAAVTGPDEASAVASIGQMFGNIRRAVGIATERGDTSSLANLLSSLSAYLRFRVSWEASGWFAEAVELMAELHPDTSARHTLVVGTAAWGLWLGGDVEAAQALLMPVLKTRPEDDPGLIEVLAAKSVVEMYLDDEACTATAIQALELADAAGRDWMASYLLGAVALTLVYRGEPDRAHGYIERQELLVRELDNETARAWWLYCSAEVSGDRDPVRTEALARAAVTAARRTEASLIENTAIITAVTVAARHGHATELIGDFAEVIERCRQQGAWTHMAVMVHNLVEALAALGADEAAVTLLHADRGGAVEAYGDQAQRLDALAVALQSRLPEDIFTRAAQVGRTLTRDEVADAALRAIAEFAPTRAGVTAV